MKHVRRLRTISPLVLLALGLMLIVNVLILEQNHDKYASVFRNSQPSFAEISTTIRPFDLSTSAGSTPGQITVPILVYHIVRPSYPDDSDAVKSLAVTPETFDAQLKHLIDGGYNVISFAALEDHFTKGTDLGLKPIIISFDDGWRDQFEYAFPILQKYGLSATFFVFTNPIGHRGFLTWDNLEKLRDAGMIIGSHSRSHPFLTKLADKAELTDEIVGSKKVLEDKLGIVVNEFAYPFGQYNPTIEKIVKNAGYASARGDYYSGDQSQEVLYSLNAMNTPTTLQKFVALFP